MLVAITDAETAGAVDEDGDGTLAIDNGSVTAI